MNEKKKIKSFLIRLLHVGFQFLYVDRGKVLIKWFFRGGWEVGSEYEK